MSGVTKADVQAAAKDLKFQTSVVKDANGKPSVQVTARAPVGFLRGSAPVHPWTKGGLSFWVPEAVRMRHFVLGFGTVGILYWRLSQATLDSRKESAYYNSNVMGAPGGHH